MVPQLALASVRPSAGVYDRSIDRRFGVSGTASPAYRIRNRRGRCLATDLARHAGRLPRHSGKRERRVHGKGHLYRWPFLASHCGVAAGYEDFFNAAINACSICEYCSSDDS